MGQLLFREVKVFAGSSLTGMAQDFGAPTEIATYKVAFVNASNRDVLISDGTAQDDYYLPAGSTLTVGEGFDQEGKALNVQGLFSMQTQLEITGVAGTAGTGTIVATLLGDR